MEDDKSYTGWANGKPSQTMTGKEWKALFQDEGDGA